VTSPAEKPVLWHIGVSHFSEKVRWALDYKGVEYERRAPMPSAHMAVALWLTRGRGKTFPVMRIGDETIGDSTAIIGALEKHYPEPPLYPEDPAERRRALDLEEFFDERLAPQLRQLAWHELGKEPELFVEVLGDTVPAPMRRLPGSDAFLRVYAKGFTALRYRAASEETAEESRRAVLAALDRLESELDGNEYLVGDRFSVADLTAAALFYPLVLPPEAPNQLANLPAGIQAFRAPLTERPGYRWVEETYSRHRKRAAEQVTSPPSPAHL
jgi:glutathione S-transferase